MVIEYKVINIDEVYCDNERGDCLWFGDSSELFIDEEGNGICPDCGTIITMPISKIKAMSREELVGHCND